MNTNGKIDTATLYPRYRTQGFEQRFRMTAVMKEPVNAVIYKKADKTLLRFPTMAVKLRSGLFWYYFRMKKPLIVRQECRPGRPLLM
ncbi:MAG: hypothetical protein ACLSB9_25120 [Hydrogeniiclostridium mannosilyticum]